MAIHDLVKVFDSSKIRVVWDDVRFEETSPGIGVPQWWYTVWLPVLCALTTARALQLFARLLGDTCRSGDLVGRLGGEEVGVLLLHNSEPAGLALDRRLRRRLHAASVAELGFALDYSAGMAVLQPGEAALAELMARADGALYAAKTAGRGRLVAADRAN